MVSMGVGKLAITKKRLSQLNEAKKKPRAAGSAGRENPIG
jgi:hypothetical protein